MIVLIVYGLGFILSYILCKRIRNISNENEWNDVFWTFIASLCSWCTVLLFVIMEITNGKKPPKWL